MRTRRLRFLYLFSAGGLCFSFHGGIVLFYIAVGGT